MDLESRWFFFFCQLQDKWKRIIYFHIKCELFSLFPLFQTATLYCFFHSNHRKITATSNCYQGCRKLNNELPSCYFDKDPKTRSSTDQRKSILWFCCWCCLNISGAETHTSEEFMHSIPSLIILSFSHSVKSYIKREFFASVLLR